MQEKEIVTAHPNKTFYDYVGVLFVWKKFIIINIIVVGIMTVGIVFLLPKWYKATASIMPPKTQDATNMLGAASSVLKGLTGIPKLGGLSQGMGVYNYVAILKSRTTMESVVKKFDLIHVYEIGDNSMAKAVKTLTDNSSFEFQDEDYLTVDVFDKDPKRAADIANYFVEILNQTSIRIGTQEAQNNREFIEKRLERGKVELQLSEDTLRMFQEKTGMMITPEQSASISAIAQLYGMKAKKEIEVGILERTLTPDNDVVQKGKIELSEINKKVATIPEIGLDALRLYRKVAIQQKIVEFLIPLFEQARIDEQKNLPTLIVLDQAVPPELKSKPARMLIILSISFISLFTFIVLVYVLHGLIIRKGHLNSLEIRLQKRASQIARLYRIPTEL